MDIGTKILIVMFIGLILFFAYLVARSYAEPQPFSINETTDFGIVGNDAYYQLTDMIDKDQNVVNLTLDFVDSGKTRTIEITDFLLYQSYEQDIYGIMNESAGKYKTLNQTCEIVNETEACTDYYYCLLYTSPSPRDRS